MAGTDAFCAMVKRFLEGKELPADRDEALHMLLNREWFQVDEDGLVTHFAVNQSRGGEILRQWVVPAALRPLLLHLAHYDETAQHPTVKATHSKLL